MHATSSEAKRLKEDEAEQATQRMAESSYPVVLVDMTKVPCEFCPGKWLCEDFGCVREQVRA